MSDQSELDRKLAKKLALLNDIPARDPVRAAQGRAAFLAEAHAVSAAQEQRHKERISKSSNLFLRLRKERSFMMSVLTAILVVFGLLVGGGGATVAAAQSSLPDQALYPVKILTEDVRQLFTTSTEGEVELQLKLAERRMEEIQTMVQNGEVPPEAVQTRLQTHLRLMLQACAEETDEALTTELLQHIHMRLQDRLQSMAATNQPDNAVLTRTRMEIHARLMVVQEALENPVQFRLQLRNQNQAQATEEPVETPTDGEPTEEGEVLGTPQPDAGYGPGPGPEIEVTPGTGYGPGPGPIPSVTPQGPRTDPPQGNQGQSGDPTHGQGRP